MDLMTLSKKDGGFIRANDVTAYRHEQLAGMFCVPIDRLKTCIEMCLRPEIGKLVETSPGIYRIPSTDDYELCDRQYRRKQKELNDMSGQMDFMSENADSIPKDTIPKDSIPTAHPLQIFVSKFPNVSKLKNQLTVEECEKLIRDFDKKKILDILDQMENKADLPKRYVSVYLTVRSWLRREKDASKFPDRASLNLLQKSTGRVQPSKVLCRECDKDVLDSEWDAHMKAHDADSRALTERAGTARGERS